LKEIRVRLGLGFRELDYRRLGLGLRLGLGFIFYLWFVSTKHTTLSLCVTVASQVAYE